MRLRAFAKINLGLDILRKREDGYHEVRMIMQTIQMYDVLEMKKVKKPGISLSVNYPYIPSDERNLVYKAAKLLMDEFQVKEGVDIRLEKFIPVAAGMAGGTPQLLKDRKKGKYQSWKKLQALRSTISNLNQASISAFF